MHRVLPYGQPALASPTAASTGKLPGISGTQRQNPPTVT